jgi:hypothetical protein
VRSVIFGILVALIQPPVGAADRWQSLLNSEVQTSLGLLSVKTGENFTYSVTLDDREIVGFDKNSTNAGLSDVIHIGGHELVVVAQDSGGISCPVSFVIIEIRRTPQLSNFFGNCNAALKLIPDRNSLKALIPRSPTHPELFSSRELRYFENVDVYVWSNGKVKHQGVAR